MPGDCDDSLRILTWALRGYSNIGLLEIVLLSVNFSATMNRLITSIVGWIRVGAHAR